MSKATKQATAIDTSDLFSPWSLLGLWAQGEPPIQPSRPYQCTLLPGYHGFPCCFRRHQSVDDVEPHKLLFSGTKQEWGEFHQITLTHLEDSSAWEEDTVPMTLAADISVNDRYAPYPSVRVAVPLQREDIAM